MSTIEAYDGLFDPTDYLRQYIAQMEIAWANDPIMYKAFSSTLKSASSTWFVTLRGQTFTDFKALEMAFLRHFMGSRPQSKTVHHLFRVYQHKDKSLRDYIQRF